MSAAMAVVLAVARFLHHDEYQKGTKKHPFYGVFFYAAQSVRRTHCSFG